MWCRLRVFIFIGDFSLSLSKCPADGMFMQRVQFHSFLPRKKKTLTFFGLFSVGIRNHNSIPNFWAFLLVSAHIYLSDWISYHFWHLRTHFLPHQIWLRGKYFCYIGSSLSAWQGVCYGWLSELRGQKWAGTFSDEIRSIQGAMAIDWPGTFSMHIIRIIF